MRLPGLYVRRLVGLTFATASACAPGFAQQSAPSAATPYDIDPESGLVAARSFELPAFGQVWKDGPEYKVGNRPLWRLNCFGNQYLHNYSYNADFASMHRSARGGPLRFDSERQGFVRPAQLQPPAAPNISAFQNIYETPLPEAEASNLSLFPLLAYSENGNNIVGVAGGISPVVSFYTPSSGKYVVDVHTDKARFNPPLNELNLNITYHQGLENTGPFSYHVGRSLKNNEPISIRLTVNMRAGEEIAFVTQSNSPDPAGSVYWQNFSVKIAYFPTMINTNAVR